MKIIEGEKLFYREITEEDTDLVLRWRNSDFVRSNFIYQPLITREEHLIWLNTKVNTGQVIQFIILEKAVGRAIGSVYLRDIDYVAKKAEYGIFIGEESACGKGYGTEAAGTMISFAFKELELQKLTLRVLAKNVRAIKSYEKAGFLVKESRMEEIVINGRCQNLIFMEIIAQEEKGKK
ncbi:MAG: GNAT family protein [Lachnospiraceae bacterium]